MIGYAMRVERDLFGEIPVSEGDVLAWMLAVPGIAPTSPSRFAWYVRAYNVAGKIRAAKEDGSFDETVSVARF
jgi:hypothetical protein